MFVRVFVCVSTYLGYILTPPTQFQSGVPVGILLKFLPRIMASDTEFPANFDSDTDLSDQEDMSDISVEDSDSEYEM